MEDRGECPKQNELPLQRLCHGRGSVMAGLKMNPSLVQYRGSRYRKQRSHQAHHTEEFGFTVGLQPVKSSPGR